MCYAYTITTMEEAQRRLRLTFMANVGNMAPEFGIYPGMLGALIRNQPGYRELVKVTWGMPTPSNVLYKLAKARADKLSQREKRVIGKDELA